MSPEEAEGTIHADDLVQEAPPVEDPAPAISTSIEEVAREAVAGHWGRGNTRKARLKAAGYDVSEVNAEIAKILNK